MSDNSTRYIFEASWEVCNKVGGIYTVLSTKAKSLKNLYKDNIIFIGPDVWTNEKPSADFIEVDSVLKKWKESANLPDGIKVRVGRWDIPGKPIAILVKFDSLYASKDSFYGHLWQRWNVDSLHAYGDYDEACAFGRATAYVMKSLADFFGENAEFIAHFNEWTLGAGLLTLKDIRPDIKTIFTTHATSIGRSICGNGKPLYDYLENYNGDQMAWELNMESKHSLEKKACHAADCFTTVSDVTAREAKQLLEREVDVVTPNGFEPGFVPAQTKFNSLRKAARDKMLSVAKSLTGKTFGEDTFIFTTAGRCEYRNKGLDVYLDAIKTLAGKDLKKNVLAFVMVPAWSGNPRADLQAAIESKDIKRLPDAVLTHELHNYNDDAICQRIHQLGFAEEVDGNVNVIYVPCYLNGNDGIFNMSYYDLLIGMDASVFASYYEPWGYTPLESIAFGIPTMTTTLSGFGQWIKSEFENTFERCGAVAIERNDSNYQEVVNRIAEELYYLIQLDEKKRKQISKAAKATASKADWAEFIKYYEIAFNKAINKFEDNLK